MDDPLTTNKKTSLSFLQPRETARAVKARGAGRMVGRLRFILPVLALLIIAGLIVWPMVNPDKLVSTALKNAPDLVIKDLNYTGFDSKNQPYSVSAAKATRASGENNLFDLEKPQGEITLEGGAWVAIKAQYGRLDQDAHQLWLGGDVQLFHDNGTQFTTDEVQADLTDRYAWGEKPVLIQGAFGEIRGAGFRLLDSGTVMIIKGPAKALLNLQGGAGGDKPVRK